VADCPDGYPKLAAFLDIDKHHMLFRRYGFLQNRLLLYKQDELRELERKLDSLDKIDESNNKFALSCRVSDNIDSPKRKDLFAEVEVKIKEYGQ
jgi:hypothetical protein